MKDYQASPEKLRREAAEAALILDLVTDQASAKRSRGCPNIWGDYSRNAIVHQGRRHGLTEKADIRAKSQNLASRLREMREG